MKSEDSIIRLVNQYKNLIFSLCLKLTGDYFTAEDITQETFLSAYENWERFDGSNEKAWLCRIASNKCVDYLRSANRKHTMDSTEELEEPIPDTSQEPLKRYLHNEVEEQLFIACDALAPPYDQVAKLYYIKGLTAREISEQTGGKLKTIQTQLLRAKEMLKQALRKEDLLS